MQSIGSMDMFTIIDYHKYKHKIMKKNNYSLELFHAKDETFWTFGR